MFEAAVFSCMRSLREMACSSETTSPSAAAIFLSSLAFVSSNVLMSCVRSACNTRERMHIMHVYAMHVRACHAHTWTERALPYAIMPRIVRASVWPRIEAHQRTSRP